MAVLTADKVTKRFGGLDALQKIDLEVKEQAIQSIIGPNGAGKTTFFNCVTGFYTPEEGEIYLEGHPIVGMSPDRVAKRGIARTYQNIRLFKNMTAIENILVGMHPHLKSTMLGGILHTKGTLNEEAESLAEARRLLGFRQSRWSGRYAGEKPALRRPAPPGDRPGPGQQAQAAAPG